MAEGHNSRVRLEALPSPLVHSNQKLLRVCFSLMVWLGSGAPQDWHTSSTPSGIHCPLPGFTEWTLECGHTSATSCGNILSTKGAALTRQHPPSCRWTQMSRMPLVRTPVNLVPAFTHARTHVHWWRWLQSAAKCSAPTGEYVRFS